MIPRVRARQARLPTLSGRSGVSIYVSENRVFPLVATDIDPEDKTTLALTAEEVRARLADALAAKREQHRWPVLLNGLLHAVIATALFIAVVWALRRLGRALRGSLARRRDIRSSRECTARCCRPM